MNWLKCLLWLSLGAVLPLGCGQAGDRPPAATTTPESSALLTKIAEQNEKVLPYVFQNAQKMDLCGGELEPESSKQFSVVHPLANGQYIVELLCFMGAYQGNYQYLLYSPQGGLSSLRTLSLDRYEPNADGKIAKTQESTVGGLSDYNPAQQTLQITTKYRGLADCGSQAEYQWQNNQFKLVEYRIKEKCDGKFVDPEKYTKVYPE